MTTATRQGRKEETSNTCNKSDVVDDHLTATKQSAGYIHTNFGIFSFVSFFPSRCVACFYLVSGPERGAHSTVLHLLSRPYDKHFA